MMALPLSFSFRNKSLIVISFFLATSYLIAAGDPKPTEYPTNHKKRLTKWSHELNADASYVGGTKSHLGATPFGRLDEQTQSIKYVASSEITRKTLLRLGVDWQHFSFGLPTAIPLPNTLQSISTVFGTDIELSENWLLRAELEPGIYSDFQDISADDVNAPFILGASYLVSEDLQFFFGLSVDAKRSVPVFPGIGLRWKIDSQWTLMIVPPRPRIQYALNDRIMFYAGGEIKSGTFRVAKNFGDQFNRGILNNKDLDYTEGRVGAGASWKIVPGFNLEAEGGAMVYRSFNFHDPKVNIISTETAPYGQLALRASF